MRVLIFGDNLISQRLKKTLGADISQANVGDMSAVQAEFENKNPNVVVHAGGWSDLERCEKDSHGVCKHNIIGPASLAMICAKHNMKFVYISSGEIYDGPEEGSFGESDPPNFSGNVFARSKIAAEKVLEEFGVLLLRPGRLVDYTQPPMGALKCLSGSMVRFARSRTSLTVLDDFVEIFRQAVEKDLTGVFNVVNKGYIYQDDVLNLYQELVDDKLQYEVIDFKDYNKRLNINQAFCVLSVSKLEAFGIVVPDLMESLKDVFRASVEFLSVSGD